MFRNANDGNVHIKRGTAATATKKRNIEKKKKTYRWLACVCFVFTSVMAAVACGRRRAHADKCSHVKAHELRYRHHDKSIHSSHVPHFSPSPFFPLSNSQSVGLPTCELMRPEINRKNKKKGRKAIFQDSQHATEHGTYGKWRWPSLSSHLSAYFHWTLFIRRAHTGALCGSIFYYQSQIAKLKVTPAPNCQIAKMKKK